jgi:hypothetical protein
MHLYCIKAFLIHVSLLFRVHVFPVPKAIQVFGALLSAYDQVYVALPENTDPEGEAVKTILVGEIVILFLLAKNADAVPVIARLVCFDLYLAACSARSLSFKIGAVIK